MATTGKLLDEYRRRRDFAKTREPKGEAAKSTGNLFVVQKHDATRLHYDFRIELDGVLKSWAITKGPSNNPADKRLAVRVEDHPLEYGSFEGTIPKGEYGGGTVMLWDEGTWEPIGDPHEGLSKGDLKLRLFGQRMKGEWVLVHMKGRDRGKRQNWLLIKHRDDYARDEENLTDRFTRSVSTGRDFEGIAKGLKPKKKTATPRKATWHSEPDKQENGKSAAARKAAKKATRPSGKLPAYRQPQLATLIDRVPEGEDWLFEMKYDGYRCLAALDGPDVRLFTRNGKDWTDTFGVLVPPLSGLTSGTALVDGEICAFDSKGRTDFSTLKNHLSDGGPLVFFAFDLLELDGKDLTGQPLTERKAKLEKLIGERQSTAPLQLSPYIEGKGEQVFTTLCKQGFEGVIAKRADAKYSGSRNRNWLKIKCTRRQEFIIAGWSPSTRRSTFASLLLATRENGKLVYRGRVGTGFSEDDLLTIGRKLEKRARKTPPFDEIPREVARNAKWVKPELVGEVAFTEFTPDGYLRHPSFLGLREDKTAKDVHLDKPAAPPQDARAAKGGKKGRSRKGTDMPAITTEAGVAAAEKAGIRLTSPDKVLFPDQNVTKGELIAYYDLVAERMLTYAGKRPLSLVRCPAGREKNCFYQKHDTGGFPDQMRRIPITESSGKPEDYFYFDSPAGIFSGVQMGVLEYHLWGARTDNVEKPERLIFDIDPDVGLDFGAVRDAAVEIRDLLDDLGLKSFPMLTGGKGVHVIAPIERRIDWDGLKTFTKAVATRLAADAPDRFTAEMSKKKRKGRMFIDYLRNERGSTAIAPFSTRARKGAPVAVPVAWKELADIANANAFSLAEAAERARDTDPWTGYFDLKQSVTKTMLDKVKT